MTEVIKRKMATRLNTYIFDIKNNDQLFHFFQADSGDLYMSSKCSKVIVDQENELLYEATETLYNNLITGKFLKQDYSDKLYYIKALQEGEDITWESDSPADSSCTKYNKLHIKKENGKYIFEFINCFKKEETIICFNTNRSKYRLFVIPFYIYLEALKKWR